MKRLAAMLASILLPFPAFADDQLPSWNDGPHKQAIINFVEKVTKQGTPD